MNADDQSGTVIEVTIRDEIGRLLGDSRSVERDDIADALRQAGIERVDATLVDAAVGHYVDTAPIVEADALADLAVAASPIPFDPEIDRIAPADDADPPDDPPDDAPSDDTADGHDAEVHDAEVHEADPMDGLDADDMAIDEIDDPTSDPEPDDGQPGAFDEPPGETPDAPRGEAPRPGPGELDDAFGRGATDRADSLDADDANSGEIDVTIDEIDDPYAGFELDPLDGLVGVAGTDDLVLDAGATAGGPDTGDVTGPDTGDGTIDGTDDGLEVDDDPAGFDGFE